MVMSPQYSLLRLQTALVSGAARGYAKWLCLPNTPFSACKPALVSGAAPEFSSSCDCLRRARWGGRLAIWLVLSIWLVVSPISLTPPPPLTEVSVRMGASSDMVRGVPHIAKP